MIVYRVEWKEHPDRGPFDEARTWQVWMTAPPIPGNFYAPWADGIKDFKMGQDYAGADSIDCLRRWFQPVAVGLDRLGYQITKYDAPNVKVGKHQVAFDIHNATVLEHMSLKEMLK